MRMKNFLIILLISIVLGEEKYYIKINNKEYEFELNDNEAANQIKSKLPFTVTMTNLNGNEVYYQFSGESFTTNTKSVGTINMGDIYLYQSNYLVLFYKTFRTSYSYSDLGTLTDTNGLAEAIGSSSSVLVEWCLNSCSSNENTNSTNSDTTAETATPKTDTTTDTDDDTDETFRNYNNNYNFLNVNYFISSLIILFIA